MALSDEGEVFMDAESGDDAEQNVEIDDIKKNLLSDLSDDSPVKSSSGSDSMPPPPAPSADTTSSTDKMRVFLRIRPLKPEETATGENQGCANVPDSNTVEMIAPKDSKTYEHSAHGLGKVINTFSFSQVYDYMTSQKDLFNDCMLSTIKDFVDGQNCLVFAYGVTNSGKTFTMLGTPKEQGIIPRSLDVIFNSVGEKQYEAADLKPQLYCEVKRLTGKEMLAADKFKTMVLNAGARLGLDSTEMYTSCDSLASQSSVGDSLIDSLDDVEMERTSIDTELQGDIRFSVWVSFAEIYNEQIFDLLEPISKSALTKRKTMQLREDRHGNPYIKDLRYIHCHSADEAIKVLTFGQKNLQYACTKLNESSSRSHCIFNVKVIRVLDKLNPRTARMSQ